MTDPTFRQLEYAIALADHQHFGHAAEAVHVTQPGLSGQIRELERRLGVELFERSPGRVALTTAGAEVIERGRRILSEIRDLANAAAAHGGTLRGRLRLAAIPTMAPYLLPPIVRRMHGLWPYVDLEIQEQQTASLVEGLERGELDIGVLALPFETGRLHVEPIVDEAFVLAMPEGHDLVSDELLGLADLRGLPMLLLPEGHCLRDHAMTACEIAGRVERNEVHAASLATLTQMVAGGVGVTLLPMSAVPVEARAGSGVMVRAFHPPAPGRTIALAWRRTDPRAAIYRELLDVVGDDLAELVGR